MLSRRWILGALAGVAAGAAARPPATAGALRLGADSALVESGLAAALQRAFGRDTGVGVEVFDGPALAVLDATSAGEYDAALVNAPAAAGGLDRQGLVHDLRAIADGGFVLVGPRGRGPVAHDAALALAGVRDAAQARPDAVIFLSAGDGSGTHVAEQAAWRAAGIAPAAPWYRMAARGTSLVAQARATGAYALVERGAWLTAGGAPLALLVDGDPTLVERVQAMRSFRSPHPAGKIFLAWIGGGRGHAVVASHRGYRPPA
jgi:tungstate transport system substrate-binding protein